MPPSPRIAWASLHASGVDDHLARCASQNRPSPTRDQLPARCRRRTHLCCGALRGGTESAARDLGGWPHLSDRLGAAHRPGLRLAGLLGVHGGDVLRYHAHAEHHATTLLVQPEVLLEVHLAGYVGHVAHELALLQLAAGVVVLFGLARDDRELD